MQALDFCQLSTFKFEVAVAVPGMSSHYPTFDCILTGSNLHFNISSHSKIHSRPASLLKLPSPGQRTAAFCATAMYRATAEQNRASPGHSAPRFTAKPVGSEALVWTILIIPASNGSTNHTSSQVARNGESAACICEVLIVEKLNAIWRRPKSSRTWPMACDRTISLLSKYRAICRPPSTSGP